MCHGSGIETIVRRLAQGGELGSMFIVLEELLHATFTRKDDDLWMKLTINLTESFCVFRRMNRYEFYSGKQKRSKKPLVYYTILLDIALTRPF